MLLYIDADQNSRTGWNGYDYRTNADATSGERAGLEQYDQTKGWVRKSTIRYQLRQNKLELAIPCSKLGMSEENVSFDFHWADNIQKDDDIIELAINGDSAPNRRFNYRFERR